MIVFTYQMTQFIYLSLNDKKIDQNSDTIDIHHVTFNGNKYNDVIIDSKSGRGAGART